MAAETGVVQGTAMEISVSKFELLKELTATQGVVERKTTIPILSNFLFEAANDRLTITATDLDLSLRTSCPAKVKREGACTIPARKLYDYVKLLPDGDISIKLLENHWVNIRSGRSNTKMVGMARANFPGLPTFPAAGSVKIPAQTLRSMIGRTIFAISSEESRYTLNGGLMVLKAESITMVATDGHRLAHIEKQGEHFDVTGENKTLIPKKAMSEIYSLLQNSDVAEIEFAKDDSTLFFRIGERLLTSRQLTGQFPNYEAVLPRETTKIGHGAWSRSQHRHPARGTVCRRALARHSYEAGQERAQDFIFVHRRGRVGRLDRDRVHRRPDDHWLQLRVPARLPEGLQWRRGSPGVQGRPVRRPDAPRRRERRRLQVPLRGHADADLIPGPARQDRGLATPASTRP